MADDRVYTGDDINSGFLKWRVTKHISSAFTGASAATHGEISAANTYRVFTVTGVVTIKGLFGVVNDTLTNATSNISLGFTGDIDYFANADDAPALNAGDIWSGFNATGTVSGAIPQPIAMLTFIDGEALLVDGIDIVETVDTADVNAGQMDYFCIWAPLEAGASIVEAGTLSQV